MWDDYTNNMFFVQFILLFYSYHFDLISFISISSKMSQWISFISLNMNCHRNCWTIMVSMTIRIGCWSSIMSTMSRTILLLSKQKKSLPFDVISAYLTEYQHIWQYISIYDKTSAYSIIRINSTYHVEDDSWRWPRTWQRN